MTTSTSDLDIHPRFAVPRLRELIAPRSPLWTPTELRDLTTAVSTELQQQLLSTVRFSSPQRWWARLAVTDEVELWLLSWLPGQGTAPHDHGGASGSFTVLLGELAETYRYPSGPIRHRLHTTGAALGFGQGRAHRVQNLGTTMAASVHAYSPPLVPTREYASLRDVPAEIPPLPTQRTAR
ncbi:cysteine dioxygenase family protein [Actinokineospora sp. PR83]|uniref:cysteine dioxygenase n=1 Tax=Actinokineospora sp. PR83 TaxID=2884908 RepID=UPI001F441CE1|nr:cysteine dioxygenase family protein [Actinokineospora sp. PR83]MCG8919639.1 cysteine dioxygenase family protein [Actinokineospora sp. PR83]